MDTTDPITSTVRLHENDEIDGMMIAALLRQSEARQPDPAANQRAWEHAVNVTCKPGPGPSADDIRSDVTSRETEAARTHRGKRS